jgi:ADP-ribose pyrophosphatase YjhB (NUDIX family)
VNFGLLGRVVERVGEAGCMNDLGTGTIRIVDALDALEVDNSSTWGHDGVWAMPATLSPSLHPSISVQLPMIISDEVAELSAHFGAPVQRTFDMQADDYIYRYRFNPKCDRRAEVVFAIEDEAGQLWVHTKPHYPQHIFRLPTGGVHCDELVVEGLLREVKEETCLPVEIVRFLGIIEYHFWYGEAMAPFASYIFHLRSTCVDCPTIQQGEPISEFRAVVPAEIRQLAMELRNLAGVRRAWGEWRALAHDLVYESLTS